MDSDRNISTEDMKHDNMFLIVEKKKLGFMLSAERGHATGMFLLYVPSVLATVMEVRKSVPISGRSVALPT